MTPTTLTTGRATPQATRDYCAQQGATLAPKGGTALGNTELRVSGIGFGGYRIHDSVSRHRDALRLALSSGVNLIDTSANYGDGGSETLIGEVLAEFIKYEKIKREQIVVVSKGGYIQGENMKEAFRRKKDLNPFPDVVAVSSDCWHCVHPEFLQRQIELSLQRLNMQTLDVYLLHNPEYYLENAEKLGVPRENAQAEYYRRIESAFAFLETQVDAGRIGAYGISSNAFPRPGDEFVFTDLEKCLAIAAAGREKHNFKVIQLPANLYEHGAWTERNQSGGTRTTLEVARDAGIGVLINRPLNAFHKNRLIRLADPPADSDETRKSALQDAGLLAGLEVEMQRNLAKAAAPDGEDLRLDLGDMLAKQGLSRETQTGWQEFVNDAFVPHARRLLKALDEGLGAFSGYGPYRENYIEMINAAVGAAADYYETASRPRLDFIHDALKHTVPPVLKDRPLSQKTIWLLRSIPGVSSVLVGMRREAYVRDSLEAATVPPGALDAENSLPWIQAIGAAR